MINNRITKLFKEKKNNILSIYFTAGYPNLEDTVSIIKILEKEGVDMIEIGIPFSDPLADGPTIQESGSIALKNGMTIPVLFDQLERIRKEIAIPLILMGYYNPILQYGIEAFCDKAKEIGIDGCIIPDLPIDEYIESHKSCFESNNLSNILLVTPQTPEDRILLIDENSQGFIYLVSSASTTGSQSTFAEETITYFKRIKSMNLKNPAVIGFGIHDKTTLKIAQENANGAIIGSAFIKALYDKNSLNFNISNFIKSLLQTV